MAMRLRVRGFIIVGAPRQLRKRDHGNHRLRKTASAMNLRRWDYYDPESAKMQIIDGAQAEAIFIIGRPMQEKPEGCNPRAFLA
ncbi:MAG TPA: hypothetical protein VGJ15_00835, partial [Pirellulales bacterium]